MKVIFSEDVANVAKAGQLKDVANGFARNYLIPKKLAVVATESEMKKLQTQNTAEAQRQERFDSELTGLADQVEQLTLNLQLKVGVNNRVYGSTTHIPPATTTRRPHPPSIPTASPVAPTLSTSPRLNIGGSGPSIPS